MYVLLQKYNFNQSEDDYYQSEVLKGKIFLKKQGIKTGFLVLISKYPDVFLTCSLKGGLGPSQCENYIY